jgi:hypothetical protein
MLSIEAIKFNHDPSSASCDALNIRVNASTFVPVPEWRDGDSDPAKSPAAYAIDAVGRNTITIQAQFSMLPPSDTAVMIRAVSIGSRETPIGAPRRFDPLGDVAAAPVTFDDSGDSGWITLEVTGGVGKTVRVENITWRWEALDPETNAWEPFAISRHRIYVILRVPTLPWEQTPYESCNTQLPWTEVLDFACAWAWSATTCDAAADIITSHIYGLGPGTLQYNCPGMGATAYTKCDVFNCTKFVARLHGYYGNGQWVNCKDCAAATSTFANIVGCNLAQKKMGYNFNLNPVLPIGAETWELPCCTWTSFVFHEVAWKPPCDAANGIFDACLKVNLLQLAVAPVTNVPPVGLQPANIEFLMYRPLLATSGECVPQTPAIRRPVV